MNPILFDSKINDHIRRLRLYHGQIFVFSPRSSTIALCELAREMIEEAFGSLDPKEAQYSLSVEEYVAIVAPLKPKFIHHPKSKQLIRNILEEFECDLEKTYLDVPRLRMVTSDSYLTSGVGYAHHPHRDTWYSAPMSQLNWWLPIYEINADNCLAFHPQYWNKPVKNGSHEFNYYEWNSVGRKDAAKQIKTDTRKQPRPEEPMQLEPQTRIICEPGGIVLFSGAQMHSTVPNTSGYTRYSIDFRTVNIDDVASQGGATNVDSYSTGTSLRDFMRGTDLERIPEKIVALYDQGSSTNGELIFQPELAIVA